MAAAAAAIIQAGAQLYGGSQNARAQRQAQRDELRLNDAQKAASFRYLKNSAGKDQIFAGLEEAQIKKSNAAALGGFDAARKAHGLGAQAARQTVLNRGAQAQASQQQSLVSRGLIGTSSGTAAASDLSGQVTQQLAGIDTELASTLAQLGIAEGIQESRGIDKLAGLANRTRDINLEREYELANLAARDDTILQKQKFELQKYFTENNRRTENVGKTWYITEDGSWEYGVNPSKEK